MLAGVRIPAGATLIPLQYSANRDEALTEDWKQGMITRAPVGLPVVW